MLSPIEVMFNPPYQDPAEAKLELIRAALDHLRQYGGSIEAMINGCPDDECLLCGVIHCPANEPLHFHHDGCPFCSVPRNNLIVGGAEWTIASPWLMKIK